jgi:hypothetical protein
MAFGKTAEQILAEEFPGKTKEQIKEILASFDAVKAKADKVDSVEATLSNTTGELATVKAKLSALEAKNQNNNNNNNNINNNNVVERPDWGEDADAAFSDRVKPVVGMTLSLQAEVIYDRVVNKLERDDPYFPKLRKEFDELLAKETNLGNKASQAYVENCYNVVFARHRHEIMRDVRAGNGEYFIETGRGQGGNQTLDSSNRTDPTKTITEEERREAAKFGLTPEKWMETRNKIKFVGGAIQTM